MVFGFQIVGFCLLFGIFSLLIGAFLAFCTVVIGYITVDDVKWLDENLASVFSRLAYVYAGIAFLITCAYFWS